MEIAFVGVICFVVGLTLGGSILYLALKARLAEVKTTGEALQALERELAALRPEANRVAQAEIELLRMSDERNELAKSVASLNATLEAERLQAANYRQDLTSKVQLLEGSLESERDKAGKQDIELSALKVSITEREAAFDRERKQFDELRGQMKSQFSELSTQVLRDNGEAFLVTAKKVLELQHQTSDADIEKRQRAITDLVTPLQESIKAVSEAAKEMDARREKAFGTIESQLENAVLQSARIARQADALRDALRKPTVRGRWGEVQLMNCIELAGMDEHCDVSFQNSSTTDENEQIRPDMEVRMPGGRKIVVDSKTPMEFFLAYIDAATDEEKNAALLGHARVVRKHVENLAKTDYMQRLAGSPDFVVMFLPNESFLAMALEREPGIMEHALQKKVMIVTPGTLIGLLKVIRYGWTEQIQTKSAKKIIQEAVRLNNYVTDFLIEFTNLGESLKGASDAYDASLRLVQGRIASKSQSLTQLGARSTRKLSKTEARRLDEAGFLEPEFEDAEASQDETVVLTLSSGQPHSDLE